MPSCPCSPEQLRWWLLQCFPAAMPGLCQSRTGSTVGRKGMSLLDPAPHWVLCVGTAVTAASSITSATPGACAGAWPLTCPFILAGAGVLMRERHLHAPSKVPFTLPPILCSLQGGLCNLCWQLGAQGWMCFGGALSAPALSCLCCCRIQVSRSHLERGRSAAGNISPCKVTAGDASFPWGHLWQLLHPRIHGGGVKFQQHKQGEGSGLGRCLERSSSSGRFWPRSSTTELLRASPPLAEIKQKSLSLKSLFGLGGVVGSRDTAAQEASGQGWPCHQPGDRFLVPFGGMCSVTEPETGPLLRCDTNGPGWGQAGGLPLPM